MGKQKWARCNICKRPISRKDKDRYTMRDGIRLSSDNYPTMVAVHGTCLRKARETA